MSVASLAKPWPVVDAGRTTSLPCDLWSQLGQSSACTAAGRSRRRPSCILGTGGPRYATTAAWLAKPKSVVAVVRSTPLHDHPSNALLAAYASPLRRHLALGDHDGLFATVVALHARGRRKSGCGKKTGTKSGSQIESGGQRTLRSARRRSEGTESAIGIVFVLISGNTIARLGAATIGSS